MIANIRRKLSVLGRILFVLLILVATFVFAMFQGGIVSWTIFYAVLPFGLYSVLLFFYPLSNFQLQRDVQSSYLQQGDVLTVTIQMKRMSFFPLLYTVMTDHWGDEGTKTNGMKEHKMVVPGWRRQIDWQYDLENMPRGEYEAASIQIEVIDFFGWVRKSIAIPVHTKVLVYPQAISLDGVAVETGQGGKLARSPFDFVKDATVVTGVRDYQSGDRMSWVHWKSFARTQTLMTKEFEERSSEDMLLVFDRRKSLTFEDEVVLAASILQDAVKNRLSIQLLMTHQANVLPAVQSEAELAMMRTHLAKMQPELKERMAISPAIQGALGKSSAVIVITANPEPNFLREIQKANSGQRAIICFVVILDEKNVHEALLENVKYAESMGMTVRMLAKQQFGGAFKGVSKK